MRPLPLASFLLALLIAPLAAADTVRLSVSGDDSDLRDALDAASLSTAEPETPRTPQDVVAAARADYARMTGALYDAGYFAGTVSIRVNGREAGTLSPFSAPARIDRVDIRVNPGRPFQLGQASIGPLVPGTMPLDAFRTGQPATVPILRDAAETAIDDWRDVGHAAAAIEAQRIQALNRDAILNADIRIAPGPRLRFGSLIPNGQERMSAARLREIAGLPEGEVFHPDQLDDAATRLRRSGVFSSVAFTEGTPNPDGTVDIEASVVEAPLRRFGAGAELSSVDGITLSGYWLHRNLTDDGERLRFDAEITGIAQQAGSPDATLAASFARPATWGPDTTFEIDLEAGYKNEDTFQSFHFDVSAGIEQVLSRTVTVEVAGGLRFTDVSDGFGERQVTLLTLPSALTWDNRDDTLDATQGFFVEARATPFYLTEAAEFGGRATLDVRSYVSPFGSDRTVLAGRFQAGTLVGGAISDLPPDFLFFSGGGGTVRGQDFRGLGAVQAGRASGGRGFLGLSGEVRQSVTDRIGLVAFYDAGFISAEALGDASGTWHSGAGFGLRYGTPFGSLRFDIATPVTGPAGSSEIYVYFGIGQSF